jgi:hypothetical protein
MSNIAKLTVNHGGVRMGAVLTKKVKALVYLCREQQRQGLELIASGFRDEELKATLQGMAVTMTPSLNFLQMPEISWQIRITGQRSNTASKVM